MATWRGHKDFPANPLEKPGYQLEFHDEFDRAGLDTTKWLPFHLPQWSSRRHSAPVYVLQESTLTLQIVPEQAAWCPEFDGENRVSSLQTGVYAGGLGSGVGQHRFSPRCVVREEQPATRTYTPQYGYFEVRAKAERCATNHVSLWMIGYEDQPERSGEIAVMEIMGATVTAAVPTVGYGIHPWGDPTLTEEFFTDPLPLDATHYHLYAAEWTPTQIDFYVDNQKLRTIHQSPNYPMQFMLGIYERPQQSESGQFPDPAASYPKCFTVDYFRAYQPVGGYRV